MEQGSMAPVLEEVGAPGVRRGSLGPFSLAEIPTGLSSWNGMFLGRKACPSSLWSSLRPTGGGGILPGVPVMAMLGKAKPQSDAWGLCPSSLSWARQIASIKHL